VFPSGPNSGAQQLSKLKPTDQQLPAGAADFFGSGRGSSLAGFVVTVDTKKAMVNKLRGSIARMRIHCAQDAGKTTHCSLLLSWQKKKLLPSGYLTVRHGKSPCLIGKPSINGPFSMAMLVITRG